MKYAVCLSNLMIGPFDSYDAAEAWQKASVFNHEPYEINGIVEPRPDHRKVDAKRPPYVPHQTPVGRVSFPQLKKPSWPNWGDSPNGFDGPGAAE